MRRIVPNPSPCHTAARQLLLRLVEDDLRYADIFRAVLNELDEPDWAMLDAGMAQLDRALPDATNRYKKDLARDLWRAMLTNRTRTRVVSPNTLAHEWIRAMRAHGLRDADAIEIIGALIGILENPDAEMLEAGIAELEPALPPCGKAYKKDLARCLWRAMLARVAQ